MNLIEYKKILHFQDQIKLPLLNMKNKTHVTLVVVHVNVITLTNAFPCHNFIQLSPHETLLTYVFSYCML
jgi:hypothetical protein